jgi:hypothetical protein
VPASAFVNASSHNYRLAAGAAAVDAGVSIPEVPADRQGTRRPQGKAYDIGAFERSSGMPRPGFEVISPKGDFFLVQATRIGGILGRNGAKY